MGIEFNRIITLLRKERGITQKQAAQDLGISQAQLSHYEKASASAAWPSWCRWRTTTTSAVTICWAAVPSAAAMTINVDDLPEGNTATGGSVYRGSVPPTMYKN